MPENVLQYIESPAYTTTALTYLTVTHVIMIDMRSTTPTINTTDDTFF